jgi:hypothetical protein
MSCFLCAPYTPEQAQEDWALRRGQVRLKRRPRPCVVAKLQW